MPVDVRCRAWSASDSVAGPVVAALDPAAGIRTVGEQEFLRRCCWTGGNKVEIVVGALI